MTDTSHSITRMAVIDALGHTFTGAMTKQMIISAATQEQIPGEMLELLQSLPDKTYWHIRDLWTFLPDIPIGD
ncbi:DUF2795 domain-containing protein [Nocardia sp. XZ_19_369]|uniref:DUF2795 domain-containing protein n=1 Tax=Nocardia sp. XZ_19_369 TaxID=2769487 RepID=UPI00188E6AD7|nr:DUF2795 domain-containing protein [Nocardia sp. XZ_19_369]